MTGHAHGHGHGGPPRSKGRLITVLALTSGFLVVEVVAGLLTGSLALLADAGHMLTDVGGLAQALFAIRLAERPATPAHTFGLYRVEILAAVANSVVLLGISMYVLFEAYQRLRAPPHVASAAMLGVAGAGLVINLAGVFVLRDRAGESLNMRGAYFEVLADLVSSVAVIAAAAVMWRTGWYYADPLLSAGIGLFILPRTWRLLREAVGVLLEGVPSDVSVAAVREAIAAVPGVAGAHDLHVWTLTSGVNAMSVHVVLADGGDHDRVRQAVREVVTHGFAIGHLTVQVEREGCAAHETHL